MEECPHRLPFCRCAAVRLSGCVQQARQLLQPATDAVPHTAAVGALDLGDLGHRHAQVKPSVDTPGLDGGQLHQCSIHFFPQLLLFQNFLRGERTGEGVVFNAVLPVQRVMGLVPELPALIGGTPCSWPRIAAKTSSATSTKTSVLYVSGYRSRRLIFCMMYLRFNSLVDR